MSQDRRLLFFGELLWDMVPAGAQPGGAAANAAVMAHACGADALLISAVGTDDLGKAMLARLGQHGLPTEGILVSNQWPTSTVDITLTADGQPSYIIHTDVAWDHITAHDPIIAAAQSAKAFYFGSLAQRSFTSRRNLHLLLGKLPADCLRFFDINLRVPLPSPEIVTHSLEYTDILKLNDDELLVLAQWLKLPTAEEDFAKGIFERFPVRTLLLTKGSKGAVVLERRGTTRVPAPTVENLVNTIGAGDAFSAGFLVCLLNGNDTAQAAAVGAELAAKVCRHNGAWLPPQTAQLSR